MSKNAYIGLFLSALVVSIALVITGKVIYSKHQSTKESPKVVLSPEQQAVVNELRQARAELEQARQELEIAKARQGLDPQCPSVMAHCRSRPFGNCKQSTYSMGISQ